MSGASRRDTLATLAGFLAVPALASGAAAGPHPDAALLVHRSALLALVPLIGPAEEESHRLFGAAWEEAGERPDESIDDWTVAAAAHARRVEELQASNGYHAAWERWTAAEEAIEPIRTALLNARAVTLEGLALKALVAKRGQVTDDEVVENILADLLAIHVGGQA